ncbi:MAG: hypothetical protein D6689_02785 [Deltaproteobacteria bacterium]|nr:MAG: hypothetical protein D6689_02785 [Deltaproteobacteria bacterium]
MLHPHAVLAAAVATAVSAVAAAQEPVSPPRLFDVPVAPALRDGRLHVTAGLSHRGGGTVAIAAGLGGVAEVDIDLSDRLAAADEPRALHATAGFKLAWPGARTSAIPAAIAIGVRKSLAGQRDAVAQAFGIATIALGAVDLHAGIGRWAGDRWRPLAGVVWRTPRAPRTTLIADVAWAPELGRSEPAQWIAHWGARYRAFRWGAIELGVRHRAGRPFDGATVLLRVHAAVDWR